MKNFTNSRASGPRVLPMKRQGTEYRLSDLGVDIWPDLGCRPRGQHVRLARQPLSGSFDRFEHGGGSGAVDRPGRPPSPTSGTTGRGVLHLGRR